MILTKQREFEIRIRELRYNFENADWASFEAARDAEEKWGLPLEMCNE